MEELVTQPSLPHHGLDLKLPNETYNAAEFQKYGFEKIEEILAKKSVPILCGGTMLWLDAISENYDFGEKGTKSDKKNPSKFPVLKIGLAILKYPLDGLG